MKIAPFRYHALELCAVLAAALVGCSDTETVIVANNETTYKYQVTPQNSSVTYNLWDVFFVDAWNGWVVGSDGIILHTSDGGNTWSPQNSTINDTLRSVYFINADTGWVVGNDGIILRTTDSGNTWSRLQSNTSADLTDVFFFRSSTGWVAGDGIILKTVNRGNSWQADTLKDTVVYAVSFISLSEGWAVALHHVVGLPLDIVILHTVDGGQHWVSRRSPLPNPLFDIVFVGSSRGWAAGIGGIVLHTSDGGSIWLSQDSRTDAALRGIAFWDELYGITVGERGTIRVTIDGGNTWSIVESGVNTYLAKVVFGDAQNIWVVGDSGVVLKVTREEIQNGDAGRLSNNPYGI